MVERVHRVIGNVVMTFELEDTGYKNQIKRPARGPLTNKAKQMDLNPYGLDMDNVDFYFVSFKYGSKPVICTIVCNESLFLEINQHLGWIAKFAVDKNKLGLSSLVMLLRHDRNSMKQYCLGGP